MKPTLNQSLSATLPPEKTPISQILRYAAKLAAESSHTATPTISPLYQRLKAEHKLGSLLYRIGLFGHLKQHSPSQTNTAFLGRHVLGEATWPIEHYSIEQLLEETKQAVDLAGVTRLKEYAQQFSDKSFVTAVVIQESHIILHGHPDGRLVIDAYTCGDADPQLILVELCKRLPIQLHQGQVLTRGLYEASDGNSGCPNSSAMRLGLKDDTPLHPELALALAAPHEAMGWHGIAEMYGCDSHIINDATRMTDIFDDIAKQLGLDVLKTYHHEFSPQGLSIAFIGQGFHLTMHAWPEHCYAPIDVYCVQQDNTIRLLLNALQLAIGAQGMEFVIKDRGDIQPRNNGAVYATSLNR